MKGCLAQVDTNGTNLHGDDPPVEFPSRLLMLAE